jgi:hypothetical protein
MYKKFGKGWGNGKRERKVNCWYWLNY